MKRNSRSHLMGNRRRREEKEEFKIKTQFCSSHKMTYTCVQAYIIDTVTWDSCHVLAGITPDTCLEEKILIRWITSALSTGGKKQATNLQQMSSDWTFVSCYSHKEQHVVCAVSCPRCPSEPVCGDHSLQSCEQKRDKSIFHTTCPSEKACLGHGDWCCSAAATQEEHLWMYVPGKNTTTAKSARFCQSELQIWLQATFL